MKNALLLTLVFATALWGQEDKAKKLVELPMKTAIEIDPEKFDLAGTGIAWSRGLDSALHKGKPVLLFQLLGNFDDVYC